VRISVPHVAVGLQLPTCREVCYNLAVTEAGKILTGLMERRALEAAFDALAQATEPAERVRLAQELAGRGDAILPVFLARLDTEDPHVRGGLGLLAQQMDRDLVVPALKGVMRARERRDQARVTALTLLDRYLNEPIEESLLAALRDPNDVARQSLRELILAMERNPTVILDYLTQLAQQPADTPELLMRAVPDLMPNPHLVTLLRMFAQGEDARLAQQALEQLGRTRMPEALRALISLAATLPAERRPAAERSLRKVRMSGIQAEPSLPLAAWQTLLSPVDEAGAQIIWFIAARADAERPTAMAIVTAEAAGIVAAIGTDMLPADDIPPAVPVGEVLAMPQPAGVRPLMLLGVPFDAGRRAVQQALEQNWLAGQPPPLAYRLFSELIWQYGPLSAEALDGPAIQADPERGGDDTGALLDHEAFADWVWSAEAVYEAARNLLRRLPWTPEARAAAVNDLAATAFGPREATAYRRRLIAMAEWLHYARRETEAQLAATAAEQLRAAPPAASPFVRRLIERSLDVAALDIQFRARRARKQTTNRS